MRDTLATAEYRIYQSDINLAIGPTTQVLVPRISAYDAARLLLAYCALAQVADNDR